MPLPALDAAQPEHFYLPKPSLARYAGFEAVVEGTRLPLNADRLVEANVLDALFEELHSGDVLGPGQGRTNISTSFTGASLLETCCFLRWLYQPDCAVHAEFEAAAAAGGLLGAARLAHKLDAGGLLEKIGSHLIEATPTATTAQLIDWLRLADACELEALVDACLDSLASKLVSERPWPAGADGLLAALDKPMLVDVMGRMGTAAAQRALAGQPGRPAAAAAATAEADRQLLTTAQSSLPVYSLSADAGAGTCAFEVEVPSFEQLMPVGHCTFLLAGFEWEVNFRSSAVQGYSPTHGALGFDLQLQVAAYITVYGMKQYNQLVSFSFLCSVPSHGRSLCLTSNGGRSHQNKACAAIRVAGAQPVNLRARFDISELMRA